MQRTCSILCLLAYVPMCLTFQIASAAEHDPKDLLPEPQVVPPTEAQETRAKELIKHLADANFDARERAGKQLVELGMSVAALLEKEAKHTEDLETKKLLEAIKQKIWLSNPAKALIIGKGMADEVCKDFDKSETSGDFKATWAILKSINPENDAQRMALIRIYNVLMKSAVRRYRMDMDSATKHRYVRTVMVIGTRLFKVSDKIEKSDDALDDLLREAATSMCWLECPQCARLRGENYDD